MASFFPSTGGAPRTSTSPTAYVSDSPTKSSQPVRVQTNGKSFQSPVNPKQRQGQWTQIDQDHADNDARHQAMSDLVQSWNDRLSLITVITTFFAATEGQLLSAVIPANKENVSTRVQVANASFTGALVVHVFAAFISFVASFFLIRYKLRDAVEQEFEVENNPPTTPSTTSLPSRTAILARNPHLEQVGPFAGIKPPTNLLRRCHTLCMWLAMVGFLLAVIGVISFVWEKMPLSVSIFASACAGVCIVSSFIAVI